jgi:hypothetical protein
MCGAKLDSVYNVPVRRDLCPMCGAELHACVHCRHSDESVAKGCKEPFAEVPQDKEGANFCEFFQMGEGQVRKSGPPKEALISAAEALFKK